MNHFVKCVWVLIFFERKNLKCSYCDDYARNEKCLKFHLEMFCKVKHKCDICGRFK